MPPPQLLSLGFHGLGAGNQPLRLRLNEATSLKPQAWNSANPDQTAYLAFTGNAPNANKVSIEVQIAGDAGTPVKVSANAVSAPGHSVLGSIPEVSKELGANGKVVLELPGVTLKDRPIGTWDFRWEWNISANGGPPVTTSTSFRVFTCLGTPRGGWNQQSVNNRNHPWVEVLEWACKWAAGATEPEQVLDRITEAVFALGRQEFSPGVPFLKYTGTRAYSDFDACPAGQACDRPGAFLCSDFLARLAGDIAMPPGANCTDCAAIVANFSNILGVAAQSLVLRTNGSLKTREVLTIGTTDWVTDPFDRHEVTIDKTVGSRVWDASLNLDGDLTLNDVHQPLLPIAFPLSNTPAVDYIEHLLRPDTHGAPIFKDFRQRPPRRTLVSDMPSTPMPAHELANLATPQEFLPEAIPDVPTVDSFPQQKLEDICTGALPGWMLAGQNLRQDRWWGECWGDLRFVRPDQTGSFLYVRVLNCITTLRARNILWQMRLQQNVAAMQQIQQLGIGEFAFGDLATLFYFTRGPWLVQVGAPTDHDDRASIESVAGAVDAELKLASP